MSMEDILEALKRVGTSGDNPFKKPKSLGNLVSDSSDISKEGVDQMLLDSQIHTGYTCYICNNTAPYQVLPKEEQYNTAELQNGLFVCKHHLDMKVVDPSRYGIRELK